MQITKGLKFLHCLRIAHRDIKPQNILWKDYGNDEMKFIISDFDLSHVSDGNSSSHRPRHGTTGWMAPEMIIYESKSKRTTAVDIFSLGCVFYYVLTRGKHPFGPIADMEICNDNITESKFSLTGLNENHINFVAALAEDLIEQMLHSSCSERPDADSVLKHPLFWSKNKVMQYYIDIGNSLRDMKGSFVAALKENLDQDHKANKVFQESWRGYLDSVVLKDIRRSTFNEKEICDLLKVIRNKSIHFSELPKERQAAYLDSQEGVAEYYNRKFPKLLALTYGAEQKTVRTHTQ